MLWFTKIPLTESLDSKIFLDDIVKLFQVCRIRSYFLWDGGFYEQTHGVAMGSLHNFFMEHFEQKAINSCAHNLGIAIRSSASMVDAISMLGYIEEFNILD